MLRPLRGANEARQPAFSVRMDGIFFFKASSPTLFLFDVAWNFSRHHPLSTTLIAESVLSRRANKGETPELKGFWHLSLLHAGVGRKHASHVPPSLELLKGTYAD